MRKKEERERERKREKKSHTGGLNYKDHTGRVYISFLEERSDTDKLSPARRNFHMHSPLHRWNQDEIIVKVPNRAQFWLQDVLMCEGHI